MITVTITVEKGVGKDYSFEEKTFYLEDEHDFKELYDCEAVRELVEIVNK